MRKVKSTTAKAYISARYAPSITRTTMTPKYSTIHESSSSSKGQNDSMKKENTESIYHSQPTFSTVSSNTYNPTCDGLNLKAAICVAFAGFLRSGEFTWDTLDSSSSQFQVARKHITFNMNGSITLMLPASKTDPYRKGTAIQLAQSNSPLCPVRALTILFRHQPKQPTEPLFSRKYGSFNRLYVIEKIKELLLRAGISTAHFSGHSLSKGAAVSAVANGISKDDIKLLGRWKSDAVEVYINELAQSDHTKKLLHLNSRLHTPHHTNVINTSTPINTSYHTLPWLRRP